MFGQLKTAEYSFHLLAPPVPADGKPGELKLHMPHPDLDIAQTPPDLADIRFQIGYIGLNAP
ncbi:MAG TPA: hypothetical protein VFF88_10890 [Methylocella sp.]|nr:hypothetical protein [Methylocella sp.]